MRKIDKSKLPFRKNVSGVLFKGNKFLLVQLLGWPDNFWKFPQGGVEDGESEEEALKRELQEELGITRYKIIGVSSCVNKYDWSEDSVKLAGFRWRGQIQKFYVVEYLGEEEEIKGNSKEIQAYKWTDAKGLFISIDHDHKNFANYKESISKILLEFKK